MKFAVISITVFLIIFGVGLLIYYASRFSTPPPQPQPEWVRQLPVELRDDANQWAQTAPDPKNPYACPKLRDSDLPKGGRMVTVSDGTRLFVETRGVRKNGRIIFLEPGVPMQSAYWGHYMDLLSKETEVCRYDRPGFAYSEPQKEVTIRKTVDNIQDILLHLRPKRVTFFGHSYGDNFIRAWIQKYGHSGPVVDAFVSVDGTATYFAMAFASSGNCDNSGNKPTQIVKRCKRDLHGLRNEIVGGTIKTFANMGNMKLGRAILRPWMKKVASGYDLEKFGGKITKQGFKRAGLELEKIGNRKWFRKEWAKLKVQVRPLRQPRKNRQIPVLFLGSDELSHKKKDKEFAAWQLDPSEYDQLKQNPNDRNKSYWRVGLKGANHITILTKLEHAQKAVKFYRQWRRQVPKIH